MHELLWRQALALDWEEPVFQLEKTEPSELKFAGSRQQILWLLYVMI